LALKDITNAAARAIAARESTTPTIWAVGLVVQTMNKKANGRSKTSLASKIRTSWAPASSHTA
jgi:hypothetical protein